MNEMYYNALDVYNNRENFLDKESIVPSSSPEIWGSKFWYVLHNGAVNYPIAASITWQEKMIGFIKGIYVMLPCVSCSQHALSYIESSDLSVVVKGRRELFTFFWEFHNDVNRRINKKVVSFEEATKIWNLKL